MTFWRQAVPEPAVERLLMQLTKEEKDVFALIVVMVVASVVISTIVTVQTTYTDRVRLSRALRAVKSPASAAVAIGSSPRRRSPRLLLLQQSRPGA